MLLRKYKCLNNQTFKLNNCELIPIRDEDKFLILKWRNEQIYHLRQTTPLSIEHQKVYFKNSITTLFEQEKPNQILFSYLENGICIGYGGLVHINWIDQYAEISFIMDTSLEKEFFQHHWTQYLAMLEKVSFQELHLHKIFTYAFDLRPHLYEVILSRGFVEEARLKEHCLFDGQFIDVLIHSKITSNVKI